MRFKYLILILSHIIFLSAIRSQDPDSVTDYVITRQDDTVYGEVKIRSKTITIMELEPKQEVHYHFAVSGDDSAGVKTYDTTEIKEFRQDNVVFDAILYKQRRVFFKRIVKGPVSLYKGDKMGFGYFSIPYYTSSGYYFLIPMVYPKEISFLYFLSEENGNMKMNEEPNSNKKLLQYFSDYELLTGLIQRQELNDITKVTEIYNNWKLQNEQSEKFEKNLQESNDFYLNDTALYTFNKPDSVREYFMYLQELLEANFYVRKIKIYEREYEEGVLKRKGFKVLILKEDFNYDHWYPVGCWYTFEKDGRIKKIDRFNIRGRKVK